ETLATLQGMTAPLLSAAGGLGRVPSDMLALIHKDETVLPAPLAEAFRQGANALGSGGGVQVHFNVTTMDAGSFRDWLARGPGTRGFVDAWHELRRLGHV